jgi:hypothetical protein
VLVGHRVGRNRAAWRVLAAVRVGSAAARSNGLRLLTGALADPLLAQDFVGFGQVVYRRPPAARARVADGYPDGAHVGAYPDLRYLEDLRRAAGNHVVVTSDGVTPASATSRALDRRARAAGRQAGHVLGALGSSGFSSGPHLHLHFMDGPDMLTAAALPIALEAEGSTFAPQAGQIIGR